MKAKAIAYLGWYGVLAILVAYGLLNFGIVAAKSFPYQLLNLSGAVGIGIEAASKHDKQPVFLNAVWALIAILVIVQLLTK